LTNDDAGPRHCYCDEYCLACTSTTPYESHDGFFCSGCDGWFHATCTGWDIHGDPPNRYMESKMYPDFKISLDSLSQEDSQPWYCIRCWEKKKFEEAAFVPWDDCTLDQQAFRLGVEVDSTILPKAMQNRIEKYVDQLRAVIKAETLKGILGSHPSQWNPSRDKNTPCMVADSSSSYYSFPSTLVHAVVGRNPLVQTLG
jgi:hypothetical protein